MRILALATIGQSDDDLSFEAVAGAMQVPVEAVEDHVIEAIGSGAVDAKLDGLNRTVHIGCSICRRVDERVWRTLETRLSAWSANVAALLDAIRTAQQQRAGAPQGTPAAAATAAAAEASHGTA